MTKGKFRPLLFGAIAMMHIVAIYVLWYGIDKGGFSLLAWVWFVGLYTERAIGVSLGNHRQFTHGSYKCHFGTKVLLAFLAGLSAEGPIKSWVADHDQHHWDTEGQWDPHSPSKYPGWKGFWWSHVGWLFFEVLRPDKLFEERSARRNLQIIKWDSYLNPTGMLASFFLPWYFAGTEGLLLAGFLGIVFHWHITWSINSVCHLLGDYGSLSMSKKRDTSRNNFILAFFSHIGEPFHANHHAKANSAVMGWKWYHLDLGKWILRLGEMIGIFWDIQRPKKV